jgi:hypothetical protein
MHAFHNHFIRHPEVDADGERDSENENDDFIKSQRSRNERSKNTNYIVHFRQPSFTQEPPLLLSAIDEDHEIYFELVDSDNNHDQKDYYEYDGCDNNSQDQNNSKNKDKNFNVLYPIMIYFGMILTIVLSATLANQKGIESISTQIIPIVIPTTKSIVQEELSPTTTTSTTDPHRRQQQQHQEQQQQQRQNHDFNFDKNSNAFLITPTTMMTATTTKTNNKRTIQHNNNSKFDIDRDKRIGNGNDDEGNSSNEAENDKKNNEQIIADVTRKFLREHSPPSFEM